MQKETNGAIYSVTCKCGKVTAVRHEALGNTDSCCKCGIKLDFSQHKASSQSLNDDYILLSDTEGGHGIILNRASELAGRKRYEEAKALCELVASEDKSSADAYFGIAYCNYKSGDYNHALLTVQRALALGHASAAELVFKIHEKQSAQTNDLLEKNKDIIGSIVKNDEALWRAFSCRRWHALLKELPKAISGDTEAVTRTMELWRLPRESGAPRKGWQTFARTALQNDLISDADISVKRFLPEFVMNAEKCNLKKNFQDAGSFALLGIGISVLALPIYLLSGWLAGHTGLIGIIFALSGMVAAVVMLIAAPLGLLLAFGYAAYQCFSILPRWKHFKRALLDGDLRSVPSQFLFRAAGQVSMVTLTNEGDPWLEGEDFTCRKCLGEARQSKEEEEEKDRLKKRKRFRCVTCGGSWCCYHIIGWYRPKKLDASQLRTESILAGAGWIAPGGLHGLKHGFPCICPNCGSAIDQHAQEIPHYEKTLDAKKIAFIPDLFRWRKDPSDTFEDALAYLDAFYTCIEKYRPILTAAALEMADLYGYGRGESLPREKIVPYMDRCVDKGMKIEEVTQNWFNDMRVVFLRPISSEFLVNSLKDEELKEGAKSLSHTKI